MKKRVFSFTLFLLISFSVCVSQVIETVSLPAPKKSGGMSLMKALSLRQSQRVFSDKEISSKILSNLLWATYGINRPDGGITVPSARTWKEFDIYVVRGDGWFVYDPVKHVLLKMGNEDLREYAGTQDFVKTAPLNLIFVADYDRMKDATDEVRNFYSATDVGFISQNVYLYCASEGLATVVRAQIDREKIKQAFKLRPGQNPVLAQTVGYPGK